MVLRWFLVHGTTLLSCTMYIALRWFLVQYMALPGLLYMVLRWFLVLWHYAGFLYNVHAHCAGFLYHGITLVSRTWHYTPVSSSRHYACSYSASSRTWHYAGFLYLALRMFLTMWCPWLIKLQLNYCFKDFKSSEPICLGFTIQDAVSKYFHHPFLKSFHPIFNK